MSVTLAQAVEQMRNGRLDDVRAFSDLQLQKWLQEGARDIARKAECLQDTADIAATASTQRYTAPIDAVRIYRCEWIPTGEDVNYPLEYRDFNTLDDVWWTQQTITEGTPVWYTFWGYPPGLELVVYPTPSTAGTFRVYYYRFPANAVTSETAADNEANTLDVVSGWEDVCYDYAEYRALRRDANPRWQEAKALYDEHIQELAITAIRWSDQAGMISVGSSMVPQWLYDEAWG